MMFEIVEFSDEENSLLFSVSKFDICSMEVALLIVFRFSVLKYSGFTTETKSLTKFLTSFKITVFCWDEYWFISSREIFWEIWFLKLFTFSTNDGLIKYCWILAVISFSKSSNLLTTNKSWEEILLSVSIL